MPDRLSSRPGRRRVLLFTAVSVLALLASVLPAAAQSSEPQSDFPFDGYGLQGEGPARVHDVDRRTGQVTPTATQEAIAADLGASGVHWNSFGTPHVLINHGGYLSGAASGEAADVARAFVRDNAELFRLADASVSALEVLRDSPLYDAPDLGRVYREGKEPLNPDVAHVVLFRQTFGELQAGLDGLLTVGVQRDGRVAWVSSSVTGDSQVSGEKQLDGAAAIQAAAADVGMDVGTLTATGTDSGFETFSSDVLNDVQRARLVALPTPTDGVRRAWEVTLLDQSLDEHGNPTAFISFVDAETGKVWQRSNRVDHLADEDDLLQQPRWRVFPANPPFATADDPSADTRELWCWDNATSAECDEQQRNIASRVPWDVQAPSTPTFTTDGNNASTAISEASFLTPDTVFDRPVSPERNYDFVWDNKWFESKCDPTNFLTDNDDSASTTNLFVMHNRMHDWSYYLGFTETNSNLQQTNFGNTGPSRERDPELGSAQAGRLTVLGRDNANQITLQDGIPGITNQYLWQPLAGAFYGTCTDGAYDMAIVAHEYMHAISNRMIAGPNTGTGPSQGQTESWSDLAFAEYFRGFGITASPDANPFALAPYVTGDTEAGIRNYGMNRSPLNYSDIDYDGNGLGSPHANGEIWSATNFDISVALNEKYDARFPSSDDQLQERCARGELAADACPGNRRWAQLMFDGFLLQPSGSSMVASRDSMLAADVLRFDGANQAELWDAFAKRGLGESAFSAGVRDSDPLPGWDSPERTDEATVTFSAKDVGGGLAQNMEVFVGDHEARVTPTADTDPGTDRIDDTVQFVPGTYEFIARADGFGAYRFKLTLAAGETRTVAVPLRRNLASTHSGATATGDGVNLDKLIDDTEETNWASLQSAGTASEGKGEGRQVEGRQVTIDLGQPRNVAEVQVSAVLRETRPDDADNRSQSRFSALRSFNIAACNAQDGGLDDCTENTGYRTIFRSADDAFPAVRPRPRVPELSLRTFDVADTTATHLRLVVRDNQCTGGPDFQGDSNPDNDPNFNPDCDTQEFTADRALLNPPEDQVRAAELQVFSAPAPSIDSTQTKGTKTKSTKS